MMTLKAQTLVVSGLASGMLYNRDPADNEEVHMMRKFLLGAAVAGLLLTAVPVRTHAAAQRSSQEQQPAQADTKTVTGKITAVGNGGHSFTLEVTGGAKQTMQFMLDKNAKVQGKVGVGSDVTVEYQPVEGGQNLALTIAAQG